MIFCKVKNSIRETIPPGSFRANVLTLMTGTSVSQAIPLLISPVLTRCYSPEDFGAFAVFTAVVSSVAVISTARYELAIMLPDSDEDSLHLLLLSIGIVLVFSALTFLAILLFQDGVSSLVKLERKWLYIVPLVLLIVGWSQAFTVWLNRKGRYRTLTLNRVFQSSVTAALSVGMGFGGFRSIGLIAASIIGQAVAAGELCRQVWFDAKGKREIWAKNKFRTVAKRYDKFPKYDIPSAFLNVFSGQIPIMLLGSYFGGVTVGFYALTVRAAKAPSALIANSILEVFKQRASNDFNKYGNCRNIYVKTLITLVILAIIPTLLLLFASPFLFSFIFGDKWVISGKYAQIMAVMFFFNFVASPLSYIFFVAERQFYNLIWQIFLFVFTISSISLGAYFNDVELSLILYSLSYSILYIVYMVVSYKLSKGDCR